ncbi:hypothetical protein, partial [Weissella paramesenteroides]
MVAKPSQNILVQIALAIPVAKASSRTQASYPILSSVARRNAMTSTTPSKVLYSWSLVPSPAHFVIV